MNPSLYDPIRIAGLEVRNRIMMAAMHLCSAEDGNVGDRIIDLYTERAAGGVGLVVVGGFYTEIGGRIAVNQLAIDRDDRLPGLTRLCKAVHRNGAGIAAQLIHGGNFSIPRLTGRDPVSASDVPSKVFRVIPRPLSEEGIAALVESYASGARRAVEAGFDAVEVHGGMGYLISQFLSPLTNKRTDRYGGDLDGRMTFACEVVEAVKAAVGEGAPVFFRMSGLDLIPEAPGLDESLVVAQMIRRAGADVINIAPGWHESAVPLLVHHVPVGAYIFVAREIRRAAGGPVAASVRINDFRLAEETVASEQADLVAMGRALLADPEAPRKAGEGRHREIRRCLGCNQGCMDVAAEHKPVSCTVNPAVGREREARLKEASTPRRILVVGGGPAGLEACRVAALRGHAVTLMERSPALGGKLRQAREIPHKEGYGELILYYEEELVKLKVDIRLGEEAEEESVLSFEPDAVIMAAGTEPVRPDIMGLDSVGALTPEEVLIDRVPLGRRVLVVGGGSLGCELALYAARNSTVPSEVACFLAENRILEAGEAFERITQIWRVVTIVEMARRIGRGMGRAMYKATMRELGRLDVAMIPSTQVTLVRCEGGPEKRDIVAELRRAGGESDEICVDSLIVATGESPRVGLAEKLRAISAEVYVVGNASGTGDLRSAIAQGFEAGRSV